MQKNRPKCWVGVMLTARIKSPFSDFVEFVLDNQQHTVLTLFVTPIFTNHTENTTNIPAQPWSAGV